MSELVSQTSEDIAEVHPTRTSVVIEGNEIFPEDLIKPIPSCFDWSDVPPGQLRYSEDTDELTPY